MAPRRVAVLDVGRTNVKVVVRDVVAGRDLFVRTTPNVEIAGPPYRHFDVEAIWAFALDALAAAVAEGHGVDAVTVTTHGASAVLLGDDGLALPMLVYEDAGPDDTASDYDALRPPFAETGSPRLPGGLNVGAQIHWQQARFPDAFAGVGAILTCPQYWTWRLTGVAACEPTSLGAHTDLWNPAAGTFSTLVDSCGWRPLFPPLASPFDVAGPILPAVAARTGLAPSTPVVSGIHDSNASLLPHLMARTPPFTVVSTGTWVIVFAVGADVAGLDPARDGLANVDAFGRPVPSARWMGGREFDLLTAGGGAEPAPGEIARVVAEAVMVLPSFVAGSGPFPHRTGGWSHDPATLSPGMRTAAVSLYAALMTAEAIAVAGGAGPVVLDGPFTRNAPFRAALQRLVGRPVVAGGGTTGTSAGAALLALGRDHPLVLPPDEPTPDLAGIDLDAYAATWRRRVG